jgi:hypothetical protein
MSPSFIPGRICVRYALAPGQMISVSIARRIAVSASAHASTNDSGRNPFHVRSANHEHSSFKQLRDDSREGLGRELIRGGLGLIGSDRRPIRIQQTLCVSGLEALVIFLIERVVVGPVVRSKIRPFSRIFAMPFPPSPQGSIRTDPSGFGLSGQLSFPDRAKIVSAQFLSFAKARSRSFHE